MIPHNINPYATGTINYLQPWRVNLPKEEIFSIGLVLNPHQPAVWAQIISYLTSSCFFFCFVQWKTCSSSEHISFNCGQAASLEGRKKAEKRCGAFGLALQGHSDLATRYPLRYPGGFVSQFALLRKYSCTGRIFWLMFFQRHSANHSMADIAGIPSVGTHRRRDCGIRHKEDVSMYTILDGDAGKAGN